MSIPPSVKLGLFTLGLLALSATFAYQATEHPDEPIHYILAAVFGFVGLVFAYFLYLALTSNTSDTKSN